MEGNASRSALYLDTRGAVCTSFRPMWRDGSGLVIWTCQWLFNVSLLTRFGYDDRSGVAASR